MTRKVNEVRQAIGAATDELVALASDAAAYTAKEAEIGTLETELRAAQAEERRSALGAKPLGVDNPDVLETRAEEATLSGMSAQLRSLTGGSRPATYAECMVVARRNITTMPEQQKRFRNFGEQLQAIFTHYASKGTNTDARLVRAPTGAGEVDPTGGGFLVQVDFGASIFMLAHDVGEILSRVNKIPISATSNGLKIPGVDETSRATGSRWGGVSSNWAAEGTAGTESKPKFRWIEFDLKKLISKMTVTDELLKDAPALGQIAATAFSEEVMFMTEDAIFEGTGAGQPFGIIKSPALVSVAKQTGQAAASIVKENIDAMWSRMWARSRKNAVWFINQDCEPQLNQLGQVVGTGGLPVYLPPGGLSAAPNGTLYGRPVIATEYSSALGTAGDILLADLSQYTIIDKGAVEIATSIHVAFDTDEMRFRVTYRVDGKPMWVAPLTPFKGTLTKSPFVAIAAR